MSHSNGYQLQNLIEKTIEHFNSKGQLIKMESRSSSLAFSYEGEQLKSVTLLPSRLQINIAWREDSNLVKQIQYQNMTLHYAYSRNLLTHVGNKRKNSHEYIYDYFDNMVKYKPANGLWETFDYDDTLDRLTQIKHSDNCRSQISYSPIRSPSSKPSQVLQVLYQKICLQKITEMSVVKFYINTNSTGAPVISKIIHENKITNKRIAL